jgi:hypothetical protein
MEKNNYDYSPFENNMNFEQSGANNDYFNNPMFNPMLQYEQAYMYYKYMCMQMEYKIKCKEYEKLCENPLRNKKIE